MVNYCKFFFLEGEVIFFLIYIVSCTATPENMATLSKSFYRLTVRACYGLQSVPLPPGFAYRFIESLQPSTDLAATSRPYHRFQTLQTFSLPPGPSTSKDSSTASRPCCPLPTSPPPPNLAATSWTRYYPTSTPRYHQTSKLHYHRQSVPLPLDLAAPSRR